MVVIEADDGNFSVTSQSACPSRIEHSNDHRRFGSSSHSKSEDVALWRAFSIVYRLLPGSLSLMAKQWSNKTLETPFIFYLDTILMNLPCRSPCSSHKI